MTEDANNTEPVEEVMHRPVHFEWVFPIFLHPKRTLLEISQHEKAVWLAPLLLLTVLALLNVLASGPARIQAVQVAAPAPENMQFYTPEQVQQFEQAANQSRGALFMYVFPAVLSIAGVWIGWVLFGSLLHFALTLSGSRSPNAMIFNLAAWSSLPTALRSVVQGTYTLVSGHAIHSQGLAGFASTKPFLSSLLGQVDIYWIAQVVLLLIGAPLFSRLARGKAWAAVFISLALILLISAVPALIAAQLGGLSGGGMIPFF